MPDVSRSDSQRSDSSRPRVSFNRDVHVKRISSPGAPRVVGALTSDGEGHLVPLPVRRERPTHLSRKELAKEAERVLAQADKVKCTSRSLGNQAQKGNKNAVNENKKFSTLPPVRRKSKKNRTNKNNQSLGEESPSSSPDRNTNRIKHKSRKSNTDVESIGRDSPTSSLDRKTAKSSGKSFVASVFSTLDRSISRKSKHSHDDNFENLKKSKKNSSSLNDLLDDTPSSPERLKKDTVGLKRSVSDAGSRKVIKNNIKVKKSGGFLSLDRLTAKRNKNKNKPLVVHSDYSDRSPARPRKNILKKSYSDSESTPHIGSYEQTQHLHSEGRKKKQLSPIIEAHPREDYFHENKTFHPEKIDTSDKEETMIHSSQLPTQKPALTRGQTVDAMVKRLSQDFSRSRGPPRVVTSAPGLITPEHRQHNNNLPFSYTKPTTTHQYGSSAPTDDPTQDSPLSSGPAGNTRAPTAADGQVIYAEVVVSGGGGSGGAVSKQTVHTKVLPISQQLQLEEPIQPKLLTRQLEETHFKQTSKAFPHDSLSHKVTVKVNKQHQQGSDEDEGLGLTMDHSGYRQNSLDYMDDRKGYNRKNHLENYNGGDSYISKGGFVEKRIRNGEEGQSSFHNTTRREVRTDYSGNNLQKEYIVRESKYESDYIIDPSARGRADGTDSRRKDFMISESYTGGRYDSAPYSQINSISPTIKRSHLGDYSKNETFKTEFLSDARIIPPDEIDGHGHNGRDSKDILSRTLDTHDFHDLSSRRDRLESRIESQRKERFISNKYADSGNYKKDPLDTRNELNRKYTTDISNNRREFLNSQLDYDKSATTKEDIRYESDKNYGLKSSKYYESSTTEVDSYGKKDLLADSGIEIDYRTKDSSTNGRKYDKPSLHDNKVSVNHHTQNVTRVELRNRDHISDVDDVDVDKDTRLHNAINHYSESNHRTKTSSNSFTSSKLIQHEQKQSDAIPTSTVLIRHWVPKDDSTPSKHRNIQPSKTKPDKIQQSDEEYDDYEKSRKTDEHRKETTEEHKRNEVRRMEERKKNGERKEIKKKPTSVMDKMRQLISRNDNKSGKKNKRKEEKMKVVEEEEEMEDPLTSRYIEYRGSNIDLRQGSPRSSHRDRSYLKGSNVDTEDETPKSVLKTKKYLEPPSPRDRRYLHGSNTDLDKDTSYYSQKIHASPKPPHRTRNHHTRASNMELDEGTPRPSHREGNRGGHHADPSDIDEHKESNTEDYHRPNRQRLATPSPKPSPSPLRAHNRSTSATLTRINNMKNKEQHNNSNGSGGSWFKSLDRLTKRGKNKAKEHDTDIGTEDEGKTTKQHNNNNISSSNKNLRFFGDTDQESVSSILRQPNHTNLRRYKSNNNNSTNGTSSNNKLQVPSRNSGGGGLRHHRSAGDVATSSAESTTEGDSSQQSQRSVVYLHAATVGDIPGPARSQHSGVARRAQSREELSSTGGSSRPLQPQTRTVSRSISVLAPWKPRHYREGLEVHYNNNDGSKTSGKNKDGKPPKVPVSQHSGNSTINRSNGGSRYKSTGDRGKENHITKQRVNKSMSVESLSRKNGSKDRIPTDKKRSALNSSASVESLNQKQSRERSSSSKKYSAMNSSAMELNSNKSYRTATKKGGDASTKKSSSKVSRSASMPKDSRLTAGWFKLRNKNKELK